MATAADVVKQLRKDHGDEIATFGAKFSDCPRLPTGIFPFDLASGGGFPMGRLSVVYGPESSGKTNIVLRAIAEGQLLYPDKTAVIVDTENSYDPAWGAILGVNNDKLIHVQPDYAEQVVDIVEGFLHASDVFVVALDSVAALITTNEIESSAEKAVVGGASLVVGKLTRKATRALMVSRKQNGGFAPAFICINQIRHKIGVMYGDPETMPGGNALKFASSLTVRLYGKNVMDKKLSPVMPAYKETSIIIKKWKMPILAVSSTYQMQTLDANGNKPGHVEDWNTISTYLKELDYLSKGEKGGWDMLGNNYKTLAECKETLYSDSTLLQEVKRTIISELLMAGSLGDSDGEVPGE